MSAIATFKAEHSAKKAEEVRMLAKYGEDPDWWAQQMVQIADGKTLEQMSVELGVKFSVYRHWIMGDVKREKEYEEALKVRKATLMKRMEDRLLETALHPTGHPSHADANRAAEILLTKGTTTPIGSGSSAINLNVVFIEAKDGKIAKPVDGAVIDQVS